MERIFMGNVYRDEDVLRLVELTSGLWSYRQSINNVDNVASMLEFRIYSNLQYSQQCSALHLCFQQMRVLSNSSTCTFIGL